MVERGELVAEHIVEPVDVRVVELVVQPVSTATEGFTTPKRRVKRIAIKSSFVSMIYRITF